MVKKTLSGISGIMEEWKSGRVEQSHNQQAVLYRLKYIRQEEELKLCYYIYLDKMIHCTYT